MLFKCLSVLLLANIIVVELTVTNPFNVPYLVKTPNRKYSEIDEDDGAHICLKYRKYDIAEVCKLQQNCSFMYLVEKYLRKQPSLVDTSTCPRISYEQTRHSSYDFIVVGAGTAGSVVARRLADANFLVLLLEAGKPLPVGMHVPGLYMAYNGNPDVDWNFESEIQKHICLEKGGICSWPRGKVVGGTSALNALVYMRGYPQDYDNYSLPGWTWDDMMKAFLKSENNLEIGTYADPGYHSTGGLLTVSRFNHQPELIEDILEAARQLGYKTKMDLNGKDRIGFAVAQATTRNGERLTTARAYLYDPIKPKNVDIIANAFVTKVLFDDNKRAIGVEFDKNGRTFKIKCKKEVIITAGALQSPQILLVSGIGPKKHLEEIGIPVVEDRPGVGKNLYNHASFNVNFKVLDDDGINPMNVDTLNEYLNTRRGPLSSTGLFQLTGFVHSKYANAETDPPDLQICFGGYQANCSVNGHPKSIKLPRYINIVPTLLYPKSVGYLELRDQYPKSRPKIFPNSYSEEIDLDILVDGINIARKLAETEALKYKIEIDTTKPDGCKQYEFGTTEFWKCSMRYNTATDNHHVGTCKMGLETDEMAVTDPQLRVYGVKCLRVMDVSVLPTVPRGNTQTPAIAIGEKGSEMVIEHWKYNTQC